MGVSICDGACVNPVTPVRQGEVAQCDGYLFTPQAESDAFKNKQIADLRKSENEILEQRLKLYMDATTALTKEVNSRDNVEGIYRFVYFGLGVLVTGFIVSNVRR